MPLLVSVACSQATSPAVALAARSAARAAVDSGQQAPGGRGGGDRAEHLALVTQQSQVSDRLAAVGEHHRQVDGDPAGIVAGAPWPQSAQHAGEGGGQAGGIGEISQQAGPGVADQSPTVGRDDKPGTRPGSAHAEIAFLLG
jgi:hypothetical protein